MQGTGGGLPRSSVEASVMEVERRWQPVQLRNGGQSGNGRNLRIKTKPFYISKQVVFEAYQLKGDRLFMKDIAKHFVT